MIKLSKLQLSMYHAQIYYKGNYPSNIGGIFSINKNVTNEQVLDALSTINNNYEIINTFITKKDNQVYLDSSKNSVIEVDRLLNTDGDTINEYFLKPFDISKSLFRIGTINNKIILVGNHLITDGYTFKLIFDDLVNVFENKELSIIEPYETLLELEDKYNNSPRLLNDEIFFENSLISKPCFIKPRSSSQTIDLAINNKFQLSKNLSNKLSNYLKLNEVSYQHFFTGILGLELANVNGSNDITTGLTLHNRNKKTKNIAGLLSVMLPINFTIFKSFIKTLKEIKNKSLILYRHKDYGYDNLLKLYSKNNLNLEFDTVINFHSESPKMISNDYSYEIFYHNQTDLGLTMNIYLDELTNEISFINVFKMSLFNNNQIEEFNSRIIKRLELILNQEVDETDYLINIVKTPTNFLKKDNKSLLEYLEDSIKVNFRKTALISGDSMMTYSDLAKRTNNLANKIIDLNINNQVILIDVNNDLDKVITLLSVIKSNNTFVFLNKNYPNKNEYVNVVGSTFTIDCEFLTNVNESENTYFKRTNEIIAVYPTTGTTNTIKAVKLKDEGILNYLNQNNLFWKNFNDIETILNIASFTFDISLENIMLSLFYGKTLVLSNLEKLTNNKNNYSIQFLSTTPSVVEYIIQNENLKKLLSNLSVLILGGEVLSKKLVSIIKDNFNLKLYNSYGPTECSIAVTTKLIENDEVTLGKPISNTNILILNDQNKPLPNGYIGNISISGLPLMDSYVGENNKPFINLDGVDYYLTSDLGFIDQNDELNFVGRLDNEIKRNGIRINLDLIDNTLKKNSQIKNSKTIFDNNIITTFVDCFNLNVEQIYLILKEELPNNYLPNKIIFNNQFLLNDSGKSIVNGNININNNTDILKPTNSLEVILFDKIKEVLNIETISINDTFISLGGTSINALMLVALLESENISLPLTLFSSDPYIKDYKDYIIINNSLPSNELLENLNIERVVENKKIKHVVLFGSTGFLGMHIFKKLIENNMTITLFIRPKEDKNALVRLKEYYKYYFNEEVNLTNIQIIETNILDNNFGISNEKSELIFSNCDLVINSAAKVDFIGKKELFYKINYELVKQIEKLSSRYNFLFYQISTTGMALLEKDEFFENSVYQNNSYNNYYLESKRLAEDYLINKFAKTKNIYIFRVGNIMPRHDDYKFQINPNNNAIYNFIKINNSLDFTNFINKIDISPVCELSKIIMSLVINQPKVAILHLFNNNLVTLNKDNKHKYIINNDLSNSIINNNGIYYKKITRSYLKNVYKIWNKKED